MKQSRYNFLFHHKGKEYIFNAATCALAEVEAEFMNVLQSPQNISTEDSSELIKNMKDANYIVDDDFDEVGYQKLQNGIGKFASRGIGLVIAPTLNCNFACPYCFEGQAQNLGDSGHKTMTPEICEAICNLVEEDVAAKKSAIDVTWYGGEPLLAKDLIFNMSTRFIDVCRKNNVKYNATIITNGYLIDDQIVNKMIEARITSAQVTIDGPREVHNVRRKLKGVSATNTFDKIIENTKKLVNKGIKVSIRINVDKTNTKDIGDLLKFLRENGLNECDVNLGHVRAYTTACSDISSNCLNVEEYSNIDLQFQKLMRKSGFNVDNYPNYPGTKTSYCCANNMNAIVIDPNGDIYKCWNDIGNASRKVGNVNNKENMLQFNSLHLKYIFWSPFEHEECMKCNILPICMGGCPYEGLLNNKPDCEKWKYNLENMLKQTCEKMAEK